MSVLAFQVTGAAASAASWSDAIRLKIDENAARHFQNRSQVGMAVGVISGEQTLTWSYGESSLGSGIQPSVDHFFEIGSITKTYTATLLALEVLRNRVKLTDPVKLYWPELADTDAGEITLESLATHHSGLPRMPNNFEPEDPLNPFKDYDQERFLIFLKTFKQNQKRPYPYEYSNVGFGLLGYLLSEKLNRISYEKYIHEQLIVPLGLTDTKVQLEPKDLIRGAQGYNSFFELIPFWDLNVLNGAGVLKATMSDLLKYARFNMNEELSDLGQAVALAQEPRADTDQPGQRVGLAWHMDRVGNYSMVSHSGATGGYRANLIFDKNKKVAATMLSNAANSANCILAPIFEKTCEVEKWLQVDPVLQKKMLGHFYFEGAKLAADILLKNGAFAIEIEGQGAIRLWARSDLDYVIREADASVVFASDSDGQFNQFKLIQNGKSLEFLRR